MGNVLVEVRNNNIDGLAHDLGNPTANAQGDVSIYRCYLTGIEIPMLKIRRSRDRLIFNMGIPIPGKTVFILRQGPGVATALH